MSNGLVKETVRPGTVWAGSERRGGERSEPPRSGEPAQTGAAGAGVLRPEPEVVEKAVRRRFTAAYKERIVRAADACTAPGQIGALLRREGLHSSHLEKWRKRLAQGGRDALAAERGRVRPSLQRGPAPQRHRLRHPERQTRRARRTHPGRSGAQARGRAGKPKGQTGFRRFGFRPFNTADFS